MDPTSVPVSVATRRELLHSFIMTHGGDLAPLPRIEDVAIEVGTPTGQVAGTATELPRCTCGVGAPGYLLCHGGGWHAGSLTTQDYRLVPEAPMGRGHRRHHRGLRLASVRRRGVHCQAAQPRCAGCVRLLPLHTGSLRAALCASLERKALSLADHAPSPAAILSAVPACDMLAAKSARWGVAFARSGALQTRVTAELVAIIAARASEADIQW